MAQVFEEKEPDEDSEELPDNIITNFQITDVLEPQVQVKEEEESSPPKIIQACENPPAEEKKKAVTTNFVMWQLSEIEKSHQQYAETRFLHSCERIVNRILNTPTLPNEFVIGYPLKKIFSFICKVSLILIKRLKLGLKSAGVSSE